MSVRTLPILFINLGGEMLYILDQRLRAQSIQEDTARKVMRDISATMFNKRFMEELFKPQEIYSKKAMRTVFDRLAHASIMRLNTASMDKLYDLMTMALKYQVSLSLRPRDILLVTLNHLDTIKELIDDGPSAVDERLDYVYRLLIQNYATLTQGEFLLIRQTLLNFFQDMHIRVSIFLKDNVQNASGRFLLPKGGPVPFGTEIPGTIRIYSSHGELSRTVPFNPGCKHTPSRTEGSCDSRGDRGTALGRNMYSVSRTVEASGDAPPSDKTSSSEPESMEPNPLATAQLDLLSRLIGKSDVRTRKPQFRLNLFNTDDEEQAAAIQPRFVESKNDVIKIDASKSASSELSRIMGELNVESPSYDDDDDDILHLMDSAE